MSVQLVQLVIVCQQRLQLLTLTKNALCPYSFFLVLHLVHVEHLHIKDMGWVCPNRASLLESRAQTKAMKATRLTATVTEEHQVPDEMLTADASSKTTATGPANRRSCAN